MLNGIFGKWLREFATLVFTQAVQAFLLAIVMTIIISCLGNAGGTDTEGSNQAAGLLAIIALASFGKIEMLVKNIFGVTSQFGDPSLQAGARGLTAGSLLAMKGGKRLLDNGSKMLQSHRQISEAKKGLATVDANGNALGGVDENGNLLTEGGRVIGPDGKPIGNAADMMDAAGEMSQASLQVQGLEGISGLNQAISRLTTAVEKNNGGSQREKYEKMLEEGKNLRRSAIRENIGGTIGGMTGAIVGLAKGDNVVETTLAGAGAGDALGEASAKAKANRDAYKKRTEKLNKQIDELTEANYSEFERNLERNLAAAGGGKVSNRLSANSIGIQSNMRKTYAQSRENVSDRNIAARAATVVNSGVKAGAEGVKQTASRGARDIAGGARAAGRTIAGTDKSKVGSNVDKK